MSNIYFLRQKKRKFFFKFIVSYFPLLYNCKIYELYYVLARVSCKRYKRFKCAVVGDSSNKKIMIYFKN